MAEDKALFAALSGLDSVVSDVTKASAPPTKAPKSTGNAIKSGAPKSTASKSITKVQGPQVTANVPAKVAAKVPSAKMSATRSSDGPEEATTGAYANAPWRKRKAPDEVETGETGKAQDEVETVEADEALEAVDTTEEAVTPPDEPTEDNYGRRAAYVEPPSKTNNLVPMPPNKPPPPAMMRPNLMSNVPPPPPPAKIAPMAAQPKTLPRVPSATMVRPKAGHVPRVVPPPAKVATYPQSSGSTDENAAAPARHRPPRGGAYAKYTTARIHASHKGKAYLAQWDQANPRPPRPLASQWTEQQVP